jgi:hypothetical protein
MSYQPRHKHNTIPFGLETQLCAVPARSLVKPSRAAILHMFNTDEVGSYGKISYNNRHRYKHCPLSKFSAVLELTLPQVFSISIASTTSLYFTNITSDHSPCYCRLDTGQPYLHRRSLTRQHQNPPCSATMAVLTSRFIQSLTTLLLTTSFYVQGYHIAPSCSVFGPKEPRMNLISGIKAAMEEAKKMVALGKKKVKNWQVLDPLDNSLEVLFLGAEEKHFVKLERTYNLHRERNIERSLVPRILRRRGKAGPGIQRLAA